MNLKQILLTTACIASVLGCTNEPKTLHDGADSVEEKKIPAYAFTAKSSLNWQPGDETNAAIRLPYLKILTPGLPDIIPVKTKPG